MDLCAAPSLIYLMYILPTLLSLHLVMPHPSVSLPRKSRLANQREQHIFVVYRRIISQQ